MDLPPAPPDLGSGSDNSGLPPPPPDLTLPAPPPTDVPEQHAAASPTTDPQVNVFNPSGELVTIPSSMLERAVQDEGFKPATDAQVKAQDLQDEYGHGWQNVIGVAEKAASVGTFGFSKGVERAFGANPKNMRGREEALSPSENALGTGIGLIGSSFFPGLGEAAIANDALHAAKEAEQGVFLAKKAYDAGAGSADAILAAQAKLTEAAEAVAANPVAKALNPISVYSIMDKAGRTVQEGLGIGTGTGVIQGMKAAAVRGAVENALFASGDMVSKTFSEEPPKNVGSAVAELGLAAVIGGAFSAPFGAVAPLWEATQAAKVANQVNETRGFIGDLFDRIKQRINDPDPVHSLADNFEKAFNSVDTGMKDLYEKGGLRENEIRRLLPQDATKAFEEASNQHAAGMDLIAALKKDKAPTAIVNRVEDIYSRLETNALKASYENDPYQSHSAINQLKQELDQLEKKTYAPNTTEGYALGQIKDAVGNVRKSLEDEAVWGGAGKVQKDINALVSDGLREDGPLNQARSTFMRNVNGKWESDPGKFQTYHNQLGQPNAEIKQAMMKNFTDWHGDFHGAIDNIYAKQGLQNPIEKVSTSRLQATTGNLSRGAKLGDFFFKKGASKLSGEGLGIMAGNAIGSGGPHETLLTLVGEHALGPILSSVLQQVGRPMLDAAIKQGSKLSSALGNPNPESLKFVLAKALDSTQPVTGAAIKAATEYTTKVMLGDRKIDKNSKDVFNPDKKLDINLDTKKLQKNLEHHSSNSPDDNIQSLQNIGGDINHYFPEHKTSMVGTASGAIAYLQSQKFNRSPASPLDSPSIQSADSKAQYERTLAIAEHPTNILAYIKEGMLTPKDVTDLATMYPSVYQSMSDRLTHHMMDQINKGNSIPYHTRLNLSMFLAQPLDSTMTPTYIQAAQPLPQNDPQQPQSGTKQKGSTKDLGKMAKSYQTPGQARESERSDNK